MIWTEGGFIPGNFIDRVYYLQVYNKDLASLKNILEKNEIVYSEFGKEIKRRPLIYITASKKFRVTRKENLPVMPLKELVNWCKELRLDNVLEQLDIIYGLRLKVKYSEIATNI